VNNSDTEVLAEKIREEEQKIGEIERSDSSGFIKGLWLRCCYNTLHELKLLLSIKTEVGEIRNLNFYLSKFQVS